MTPFPSDVMGRFWVLIVSVPNCCSSQCFVFFNDTCVRTVQTLARLRAPRRCTLIFAGCICDKYHYHICWLKSIIGSLKRTKNVFWLSLLATASRLYAIAWGFLLRHKRIFITAVFIRALLLNQTQCGTITAN